MVLSAYWQVKWISTIYLLATRAQGEVEFLEYLLFEQFLGVGFCLLEFLI